MDTAEGILHDIIVSHFYLILLCFFWFGDVAWCQGTAPRPFWSAPGYKVSAPPNFWPQSERTVRSSKSRTTPKAAPIQIPDLNDVPPLAGGGHEPSIARKDFSYAIPHRDNFDREVLRAEGFRLYRIS